MKVNELNTWLLQVSTALILMSIGAQSVSAKEFLVSTVSEFDAAVEKLEPGDGIVMANGEWRDVELVFTGKGTADKDISLTVQTPGEVLITGKSNLSMAGEYLLVSGLVFKNGYTPTSAVISYRITPEHVANNSRVTQVVIDNFSNPERYETDYWVAMYGKNNRFDHNHLQGKNNKGVTLAVRLDSDLSRENHHSIDHNYFGPREVLGSNGGETLRVGTSHYSLSNSFTRIQNNVFDRCDGELEIISIKSGSNIIEGNVFLSSRGTLTLRHGNDNLVQNNVFFGGSVPHTGGIRVINKRQTIHNNYMEALAGYRFGGALVVMNGVPNSPINRYHQVDGARITNNSIINSPHIQLAAGSDEERSAVPVNSHFENNLVYITPEKNVFTLYDDVTGITFKDNLSNSQQNISGFSVKDLVLQKTDSNILFPKQLTKNVGFDPKTPVVSINEVGVDWYEKPKAQSKFEIQRRIKVDSESELVGAINSAQDGDEIHLSPGSYRLEKILDVKKSLSVVGAGDVIISYERPTLFVIHDGGSLRLSGLTINGKNAPDNVGNSVIRTSPYSMLKNYELVIENTKIIDLDVNRHFNVLNVAKSTMADSITLKQVLITNVSGAVLKLNKETDDYGIFNADFVTIEDSTFNKIQGAVVELYRGGTDESTFGPHFAVSNSAFTEVGRGRKNASKAALHLHGVQHTMIVHNRFENSAPIVIDHTVGEPVTHITKNSFVDSAAPVISELFSTSGSTANISDNKYN